jgi:hypothetical protein
LLAQLWLVKAYDALRLAARQSSAQRPAITTVRCTDRAPNLVGSSLQQKNAYDADLHKVHRLASTITPANPNSRQPQQSPTVTPVFVYGRPP